MDIDEIKALLKSGDVAGAEAAAQELLAAEPDNVQAMMFYGTCRQLQGDEATFRRIHDELAPKMATVADGEKQGHWRKYREEFVRIAHVDQLRLGRTRACFCESREAESGVATDRMSTFESTETREMTMGLYGNPPIEEIIRIRAQWEHKERRKRNVFLFIVGIGLAILILCLKVRG